MTTNITLSKAGKRVLATFEKAQPRQFTYEASAISAEEEAMIGSVSTPSFHRSTTTNNKELNSSVQNTPLLTSQSQIARKESFDLNEVLEECNRVSNDEKSKSLNSTPIRYSHLSSSSSQHSSSKTQHPPAPLRPPPSSSSNSQAPPRSDSKEELLKALAALQQQNRQLTLTVSITQAEALRERQQRLQLVSDLEDRNRQLAQELFEAQMATENRLEAAKAEFIASLHRMDKEKEQMVSELQASQERRQEEAGLLAMQAAALTQQVTNLQREKETITEEEKLRVISLQQQLQSLQQKGREQAEQLTIALKRDQAAMNDRLSLLEQERAALSAKLLEAERAAEEQQAVMARELEQQRLTAASLAAELALGEQPTSYPTDRTVAVNSHDIDSSNKPLLSLQQPLSSPSVSSSTTTTNTTTNTTTLTPQEEERNALAQRLKQSALAASDRVSSLAAKLEEKKKRRLQKAAQRLSADLLHGGGSNHNHHNISSHKILSSKRSLLDLMLHQPSSSSSSSAAAHSKEEKGKEEGYEILGPNHSHDPSDNNHQQQRRRSSSGAISPLLSNGLTSTMSTKNSYHPPSSSAGSQPTKKKEDGKENKDHKSIMDGWDSDDDADHDNNNHSNKENNNEQQQFMDLPAPHAAAAMGDLHRLNTLRRLDSHLLDSLDDRDRQPLFYAAAHGQVEALRLLLCDHSEDDAYDRCLKLDRFGDMALHAAAVSANVHALRLILEEVRPAPSHAHYKQFMRYKFGNNEEHNHSQSEEKGNQQDEEAGDIHNSEKSNEHPMVNFRNANGMTAAHLADSGEALELLCQHGADLTARDHQQRTPLFVACALDRLSCAEFLAETLDHSHDGAAFILAQDERGDTCLHAAACNDSLSCLLLLLQFGIDPRTRDSQGLRAVDLAVRNGHHKCREALAEYHLHYCTSSEFDSVLFLATLEGHRAVTQQLKHHNFSHVGNNNGHYSPFLAANNQNNNNNNIISPGNQQSPYRQQLGAHFAFKSMFSLRGQQTMRLQRIGDWIAYHDPGSEAVFWFDHSKGTGQWEQPADVTDLLLKQQQQQQLAHQSEEDVSYRHAKSLQAKMSMQLRREGDWIHYITEKGRDFFYHETTGAFSWENPNTPVVIAAAAGQQQQLDRVNEEEGGGLASTRSNNADSQNSNNTSPWRPYLDEATGVIFWYNHETAVSQWESPFEQATERSRISYGEEHNDYHYDENHHQEEQEFEEHGDEEIVAVHTVGDLDF